MAREVLVTMGIGAGMIAVAFALGFARPIIATTGAVVFDSIGGRGQQFFEDVMYGDGYEYLMLFFGIGGGLVVIAGAAGLAMLGGDDHH